MTLTLNPELLIDRGHGPALVVIPGIQGRWEYVRPAVDALSAHFRVITFPLCDEDRHVDPARGLDPWVDQVAAALKETGLARATICGISFGGLVALRFVATHPSSTQALVLASTPGPGWQMRSHHAAYARAPRLLGPFFVLESPWRLRSEIAAAFPERRARWAFRRQMLRTIVDAPLSLPRMAGRARLASGLDVRADCAHITAPTLVVTGEPQLDRVVPVSGTMEYARCISGAQAMMLERTGHLGTITRPREFADAVKRFVDGAFHAAA